MTVFSCLQECRQLGITIDQDLYRSLWMTLVAGRHLAVASPEPSKTAETISYICNLWGFKEQTRIINLESGISFEDLAPLLHSQLAVVVFVSLEFTDSKFQQELASFINTHHGGRLSMVSVIANKNNIEVSLRQSLEKLIWLREVHRGEVPETDNAPSCSASEELENYRSRAKKVKIVRDPVAHPDGQQAGNGADSPLRQRPQTCPATGKCMGRRSGR
ncbi:hypothetical protein KL918_001013 [Ogataea parapolymorpha]|nr:hypothetical protein KL918_001013 [Ogataea parapolymorpha]KAG7875479.1 hypothetical protein KL916_000150 [Ogataea parapolymorpha]